MALVNIALTFTITFVLKYYRDKEEYRSNLYSTDVYSPFLKNPSKIKHLQFNEYKLEFHDSKLPEFPVIKIDVVTKEGVPVLVELASDAGDNDIRSYYYALNDGRLSNYLIDGIEAQTDRNSLCYYDWYNNYGILDKLPYLKSDLKGFKTSQRISGVELTIEVDSEETADEIRVLKADILEEPPKITEQLHDKEGAEVTQDVAESLSESKDVEKNKRRHSIYENGSEDTVSLEEEAIRVEYDNKAEPAVYTGPGLVKPLMHIKSAYDQSVLNFMDWYDLQLNPKYYSSITIDETCFDYAKFVSSSHYLFVPERSINPSIDFSTRMVNPSVRKYLYNANNPSYYYLYKESLTGSEFSELAKKLLYPHVFEHRLFDTPDPFFHLSDCKKVFEQEVPADFEHKLSPPISSSFIGVSMSSGGLFYPYFLGVLSLLAEYNIININTPILGASSGSIAAGKASIGMDFYGTMAWADRVIGDYEQNGAATRINTVLAEALPEMFPDDAFWFLNHRIGCGMSCCCLYKPICERSYASYYYNKKDLVDSILSSAHIPIYSDKRFTTVYRGKKVIDGGTVARFNIREPASSGAIRNLYATPYNVKTNHDICGFNNVISLYSDTKIEIIKAYLLLKSVQLRFLLIKRKLEGDLAEWKNFISAIILYSKHLINGELESESMVFKASKKIIRKYMNKDEMALIEKLLYKEDKSGRLGKCCCRGKGVEVDPFTPQIGIIEWMELEKNRLTLQEKEKPAVWDSFSKIGSKSLAKIKEAIKSPEESQEPVVLKKLICFLSDFLMYVTPPMSLTYYYTDTPTILFIPYTFFQDWGSFFFSDTSKGVRSRFDQGRGAVYRWLALDYISMENFLYDKYKYYLSKLYKTDKTDDPIEMQSKKPEEEERRIPLSDFQRKQMYYITNIMKRIEANKSKKSFKNKTGNSHAKNSGQDNASNYLFVKRNNLVKRAIEIELLDNTDYTHILTHTHHWLNTD